jgi:hypothetical protein
VYQYLLISIIFIKDCIKSIDLFDLYEDLKDTLIREK